MKKHKIEVSMIFIILFGVVSLFSDMTHEGANSIKGAYLSLLGASASTVGFVSGFGEMIGYSLRYLFGKIADKSKQYWFLTIFGYVFDMITIPALALVGEHGWVLACGLLIVQRIGKAIRKPAKDTIMSFAASQQGVGRSFAIQEVLDQIGAFLGPILIYLVMLNKTEGSSYEIYAYCFKFLVIPAIITIALLVLTRIIFPHPDRFEPEPKTYVPFKMDRKFIFYIVGISIFAFGFIDYSLILLHIANNQSILASSVSETSSIINTGTLPLLYAMAMFVDAISALVFGYLYDYKGAKALVISTVISAPFVILIFGFNSVACTLIGIALWGIGMGAQESILKAAVTSMVPKSARATGYGIFEFSFGIFWFLGSWLMGVLYQSNLLLMIAVSFISQLLAIPCYLYSSKD